MSAVCRNLWYVSLDSMKFNSRRTDIRMESILKRVVNFQRRPRHTTPEEFENGVSLCKRIKCFPCIKSEVSRNATIAGYGNEE